MGAYIYIEFEKQEEKGDPLQHDMLLSFNASTHGNVLISVSNSLLKVPSLRREWAII